MVISAPTNRDRRIAIRQTWGQYASGSNFSMAFLIGTTKNQSTEISLEAESDQYGDIIRAHFLEDYYNLTLKTISMLEWVDTYCSRVPFILHVDDDVFINVKRVMSFIDEHRLEAHQKIIFGQLRTKKFVNSSNINIYISFNHCFYFQGTASS